MQCRQCLCELRIRSAHEEQEEAGIVRVLVYGCTNRACPLCGQEQTTRRVLVKELESP